MLALIRVLEPPQSTMIFPHLLLKENAAIINKTMLALIRVLEPPQQP